MRGMIGASMDGPKARIVANARFLFELPEDSNADSSASLADTDFMSAGILLRSSKLSFDLWPFHRTGNSHK